MDSPEFVIIPKADFDAINKKIDLIATDIIAIRKSKEKEFLTVEETCLRLRCTRNTLENYIKAGKLFPLVTHRGTYKKKLFRNAEIEHFLRNQ